jgi:predicted GIY-YIG superfamily endonuclease
LEIETGNSLPFLDVLVYRNGTALQTTVYRKPTHTGRYLHFNSNHPPHVKRGVVDSLINRAITLCTEKQEYAKVVKIRQGLATNGYTQHLIDSVLKRTRAKSRRETDETRLSAVVIKYVKGISKKFRRVGERYNTKTVFKTRQTLRTFSTRTRPHREVQDMRQCIYSIPCESGRCYIGETGRPLGVRIREHMKNLKQGLMEKSRLAKHAYEEGHRIQCKEAKALQIEINNIRRKYKEAAHMAFLTNPINEPSLEISHIWIPLIREEVDRLQASEL